MSTKYYITTPLYYVNDEPHIGHAYTTILADVLTRYHRLFGDDARFLTGTDEHGQKIVEAASKAGRTPIEHCDLYAKRFVDVWEKLGIDYDVFFRTTHPDHQKFVEDILTKLNDQGDIYSADYSGWYCTPDERFWTDKDVIEGNCPTCGRPVQQLTEKNYFFRMGKQRDWLIDWINSHPDFIKPESRKNEVLGFLKQELGDLCISRPRSRLAWGIPLPFDTDYVTYVWFDALLNYLSATRIHIKEGFTPDLWPASLHLIGKDILTTHAVYWPTMLHAAGFEPPTTIFAHGWWLMDGGKMSKSIGNVVKPLDMVDKYGADAFRYVLMAEMTPGQDATFSEDAFIKRYNSDLANDLGNLYSRLAKLWDKFGCHEDPDATLVGQFLNIEPDLARSIEVLKFDVSLDIIEQLKPNEAIERVFKFVKGWNRQLELWALWKANELSYDKKLAMLTWAFRALNLTAELLTPVMPTKMRELQNAIGIIDGRLDPKQGVNLFPRIEVKSKPTPPPAPKVSDSVKVETIKSDEITIDDFAKVDIRVGKVIEARRLEGSDKLLVLQIQGGDQIRQIVAGIAQSYDPETLIGHSVIFVANLKPAKLRGEWSHGMILAASNGERHFLVVPEGSVEPGSKVK